MWLSLVIRQRSAYLKTMLGDFNCELYIMS